jgi:hypothetical protein
LAKSEFASFSQIERIKKEIKRVNLKLHEPISLQEQLDSLLHEGLETQNPTQIINSHQLGADWESKTGIFWGSAKSKLREILEMAVKLPNPNGEFKKLFDIHYQESRTEPSKSVDSKFHSSNILNLESTKKKIKKQTPQRENHWESTTGSYNWYQASQICSSRDLRLPTIEELEDSYESGETESWTAKDEGKRYWSSSISMGENGAYNLDVFKGEIRWDHLSNYAGVRCLK